MTETADFDELDEALAPFSEQFEVAPYRQYIDRDPSTFWRDLALSAEPGIDVLDDSAVLPVLTAENPEDQFGIDEVGLYVVDTSNPNGRWDYWSVGGSFAGTLRARPGRVGMEVPKEYRPIQHRADSSENGWDRIRSLDLDVDAMRDVAGQHASDEYDRFSKIVDVYGPLPTEPKARGSHTRHATVIALRDAGFTWNIEALSEYYDAGRDRAIQYQRLTAVSGNEFVTNGEWLHCGTDPLAWVAGRVPWWTVSNTLLEVNRRIDEADDDAVFTVVDCHW